MSTQAQSLISTLLGECRIRKARHEVALDELDHVNGRQVFIQNTGPQTTTLVIHCIFATGVAVTFWLDLGGVTALSDGRFPARQSASLPTAIWIGRVLSGIVVVLLFADAVAQLVSLPMLRADVEAIGFPFALSPVVGAITMTCVVLYANSRTALLGAIMLTGFLGSAICLHLRLGEIGSPPQIISMMLGVMTWGGLYLREPRLRTLLPLRA